MNGRSLDGEVAIVTGGAQGIGKATALMFLRAGARVLVGDIDPEAGEATVEEYADEGRIAFVRCDVGVPADVEAFVGEAVTAYGRIDALVNNAGIGVRKPLAELALDEWQRVLDVNLTGTMLCAKLAHPHLAQRGGAIVNIASTRALMSEPDGEAYAATKGGIVALTHSLAASFAPDVRVNCISPGWIETGPWKKASVRRAPHHSEADRMQHFAGRVGVPEDIARMAVYLCSPMAGFISGQNFVIDGGMTKKMIYV